MPPVPPPRPSPATRAAAPRRQRPGGRTGAPPARRAGDLQQGPRAAGPGRPGPRARDKATARAAASPVTVSATDPDSRIVLRKGGGWIQGWNFQLGALRRQLAVYAALHDSPADKEALIPAVRGAAANAAAAGITGWDPVHTADCGYASAANFQQLAGVSLLVSTRHESATAGKDRDAPDAVAAWDEMTARLAQPGARDTYRQRGAIVEPGFAQFFARFGRTITRAAPRPPKPRSPCSPPPSTSASSSPPASTTPHRLTPAPPHIPGPPATAGGSTPGTSQHAPEHPQSTPHRGITHRATPPETGSTPHHRESCNRALKLTCAWASHAAGQPRMQPAEEGGQHGGGDQHDAHHIRDQCPPPDMPLTKIAAVRIAIATTFIRPTAIKTAMTPSSSRCQDRAWCMDSSRLDRGRPDERRRDGDPDRGDLRGAACQAAGTGLECGGHRADRRRLLTPFFGWLHPGLPGGMGMPMHM